MGVLMPARLIVNASPHRRALFAQWTIELCVILWLSFEATNPNRKRLSCIPNGRVLVGLSEPGDKAAGLLITVS